MESHEKDLRSVVQSDEQCRAVQDDYRSAGLSERETTILDFAVKLTKYPAAMRHDDLNVLRARQLSDDEIVDAVHCIGYFNFINRVLDGLGVDPDPGMLYAQRGG